MSADKTSKKKTAKKEDRTREGYPASWLPMKVDVIFQWEGPIGPGNYLTTRVLKDVAHDWYMRVLNIPLVNHEQVPRLGCRCVEVGLEPRCIADSN